MEATIELREMLGLDKRTMNADLAELARDWERIMESILHAQSGERYAAPLAFEVSLRLSTAYLRGRGYRLGNPKSFKANVIKLSLLPICLIAKVEEKGKVFFPTLCELGLGSIEQAYKTFDGRLASLDNSDKDILGEAEQILRAKQ